MTLINQLCSVQEIKCIAQNSVSGTFKLFGFNGFDKILLQTTTINNNNCINFDQIHEYYSGFEILFNCNIKTINFKGQYFNVEDTWKVSFKDSSYKHKFDYKPLEMVAVRFANQVSCDTLQITYGDEAQDVDNIYCICHNKLESEDTVDIPPILKMQSGTLMNLVPKQFSIQCKAYEESYEHKCQDLSAITLQSGNFGSVFVRGINIGVKHHKFQIDDKSGNINNKQDQGIPYIDATIIQPTKIIKKNTKHVSNDIEKNKQWNKYQNHVGILAPIWNVIKYGKFAQYDPNIPIWSYDKWICSNCDFPENAIKEECSVCAHGRPRYTKRFANYIRVCLGLSAQVSKSKCDEHVKKILHLLYLLNTQYQICFHENVLTTIHNKQQLHQDNAVNVDEDKILLAMPEHIQTNEQILKYLTQHQIYCEECKQTPLWSTCTVCDKQNIPADANNSLCNIGASNHAWYKFNVIQQQEFEKIDHFDNFYACLSKYLYGNINFWQTIKFNVLEQMIIHKGYFHNVFLNDLDFSSFILYQSRFGSNIDNRIFLAATVATGCFLEIYGFNEAQNQIVQIYNTKTEGSKFWLILDRPVIKLALFTNNDFCLLKYHNVEFDEILYFDSTDYELSSNWFKYWFKEHSNFDIKYDINKTKQMFCLLPSNSNKKNNNTNNSKSNKTNNSNSNKKNNNTNNSKINQKNNSKNKNKNNSKNNNKNNSKSNKKINKNNNKNNSKKIQQNNNKNQDPKWTYKSTVPNGPVIATNKQNEPQAHIILGKSIFHKFCDILTTHTQYTEEINDSNFNLAREEFTQKYTPGLINQPKFDPNKGIILNLCAVHGKYVKQQKKQPKFALHPDEHDEIKTQICIFDECKEHTTHAHCVVCDQYIKFTGKTPFKLIEDHCVDRHYKPAHKIFDRKMNLIKKVLLIYFEGIDIFDQNSSCFFPDESEEYHMRMQAHHVWETKNQLLSVIKQLHMGASIPSFCPKIMCFDDPILHKNWFVLYFINDDHQQQAVAKITDIDMNLKIIKAIKYTCNLIGINSTDKSNNKYKKRFHSYHEEKLCETQESVDIKFKNILNCCEDYHSFYINWGQNIKEYINEHIDNKDIILADEVMKEFIEKHQILNVLFPTHYLGVLNCNTNKRTFPFQCKRNLGHDIPCEYEENTKWQALKTLAITKTGLIEIVTEQYVCKTHKCKVSASSGHARLGPNQKLSLNFRRQGNAIFETDVINVLYRVIGDQTSWCFQEAKRNIFDRMCTSMVDNLVDYCNEHKLILPNNVIRFLCSIIKTTTNLLPWIGTWKRLILDKAQPAMVEPYQSRIYPLLQATQNVIRIDGSHKTCKNITVPVETVEWDEDKKRYLKKDRIKKVNGCWVFCSDEIGCSTLPALIVGAENSQAMLKLFVQVLKSKKTFWLQHKNLPKYLLYPTLISGDKPTDLIKPFYQAADIVNGKWKEDQDDGRYQVLFARDIFHELQQHCGRVSASFGTEKTLYSADFSQVFWNLRGIPRPIPAKLKFDKTIQASFATPKIKELIKGLLKNDTKIFEKKGLVYARNVLVKLILKHKIMSQWYIGAVLMPVPATQITDFVITYINEENEQITFNTPLFPSNLFCKLLSKLFPTNKDQIFYTWDFIHSNKEQFKYHLKNTQLWYKYQWSNIDGTDANFMLGITTSGIIEHEYEKIFKEPKFTWLFNNRYDGCHGSYGTSPQESHHSLLEKVPALRRIHDPITAIKIVNDIQCRENYSILNKQRDFVIAESDRKLLHCGVTHAANLFEKLTSNKLGIQVFDHLYEKESSIKSNKRICEKKLNNIGLYPGRGRWSKQASILLKQAIDELILDIQKCIKSGGLLNYLCYKCGKNETATTAELVKNHFKEFQFLLHKCDQKFGSDRFHTIADNNAKLQQALSNIDDEHILDLLRPGLNDCQEVLQMKQMKININQKFSLSKIKETQKRKKIAIPTDMHGNSTTNDKLLQTVKLFIVQNSNKFVQEWDFNKFFKKINLKYDKNIKNCILFYLYHIFMKPDEPWSGMDKGAKLWQILNKSDKHLAYIDGSAVPSFSHCAAIQEISERPLVKLIPVVPPITLSGNTKQIIPEDEENDIEIITSNTQKKRWEKEVHKIEEADRRSRKFWPPKLINEQNELIDFEYNNVGIQQDFYSTNASKRDIKMHFNLKKESILKDQQELPNKYIKNVTNKTRKYVWKTGVKIGFFGSWKFSANVNLIEKMGGIKTTHPETNCFKYIIGDITKGQLFFGSYKWAKNLNTLKQRLLKGEINKTQIISEQLLVYEWKHDKKLNVKHVSQNKIIDYWPFYYIGENNNEQSGQEPAAKKRKLNSGKPFCTVCK